MNRKTVKVLKFVAKTSFKAGVLSAMYLAGHAQGVVETKKSR
ncbi:hypothetical protein [uncultured Gordonia sp.]|jgi:hypothetical protein|nr:hypothetical protein [uncultured Gordonia sp.]